MADLTWSPSPDLTWATETPAKEASPPPPEQDGAITRGAKQAINSARRAGDLLLGDYASAADRVAEADTYRRANPGTPEGNELMAAWERGDGVAGGVSEVAGEMTKDWNEAPSTMGKLRATGKNLAAMGGGIIEQIPNMVAPMGGMLLGGAAGSLAGPVGTVGGAFAGATAGNTAMETGEQVDRALMAAGINPQDKAAVQAFLAQNGDKVLGQATTKGAIIGAVDTATMGLSHFLLSAPGKAAANRALSEMGVDAADHLAAKAAMQSPEFAARVAADPLAKVSLGRNAAVAALEPAGEFTGEYVGQGVATGDWDTKGATLEALSALGQGGITFAGQKLYQAATSPLRAGAPADPAVTPLEQDATNAALAGTLDQYDQLGAPNAGLLPAPAADPNVIIVPTQAGGTTTVDRRDGPISDAAADAVQGGATADMLQNRSLLQSYPDQAAAQAALDLRPDGDRLRVARHPRATGRFAVVPKDAQTLRALDENRARQQQIAEEDGNATQVDAAGHSGPGDVGGGSPGDAQPDVGRQPGGSAAAGGAAPGRATDSFVGDAHIGDAALDELAPAPVQPVSSMPGIQARDQARIAQARAEAEARGARLVDEEASAAHPSPSTAQIAAGNYQKGHIKIGPLDLSIENPVGSTRSGTENGKAWETTMQAHYGYVKRTEGADGDQVDVFVRAGTASDHNGPVYVVDQANPKTGRFDEHKAMIGYGSAAEAARAYDAHFGDKSGPKRRKAVVAMPMADFNNWARNGDTSQPISRAAQEADAAQAEIASSTGLQSKSRRQEGESDTAYHARMAAESNARKQGKATSEAKPAPVTDHQKTVAEVIGADPAEVSIVAAKDLPSGGKGISRQYAQFLEQVARLFKKKVVVFSSDKKVDGFWIRGDTIYVGQETSVGHLRILGHELTHVMRREAGPAYDKMLGAVRSLLTEEELRAQYLDYFGVPLEGGLEQEHEGRPLRDFLSEEWMADLSGNRFGESAFWTEVFQKIEEQYGDQQAKGIINRVRMALAAALNKILSTVSGARFAVDRRLNAHLDDIRKAVAQGFADYAIEVKRGVKPAESGAALMARGSADQTLPTRWPTAKKVTPSVDADMITDLATLKQDQTQYAKAVGAVLEEPGMHSAEMATGTLDEKAEHVIGRMQENLLWLFDQVPEAVRNRSKLWYDGARKIAEQWARQYDITESQAAGALAVLSPQKDWFMNVTMAERVLDIIHTKMNHRFDEKMRAAAFAFLVKDAGEDGQRNTKAFNRVRGKTLAEVAKHHDLRELSVWIRAYDEAYHDPKHAIVTPEGGFVEDKTTVKGEPTMRAWGDFTTPGKAASIYLDGSPENINKQLGGEHKVRNFYNNIYAPKDARFTTIDTHAVAADLLRPLAGADKPVADNFGKTGGTSVTGLSGTYALHYEAYRRAAEARGVLPREMQSIAWEAVRGLFTEGFKGKKHNLTAVDAVWRQVDAGKLEVAKAREQIVEMAGGIEQPDWWNEGNAGYQEVLRDTTYAKERSSFAGAKVTFEVAPDPRNAELKARWDALPAKDKLEISDKVAWKIAAKALASFNDDNMKGELHHQAGGWMADTNPSLSIWFNKRASGTKINQFARMLGFALQQESMMRTSPRAFMGSDGKKVEASGAVLIDRKPGDNVAEIYAKVRTVLDPKGKPYVQGHTTSEEQMVVIHQNTSAISTEDLARKVADAVGLDYAVRDTNIYAEFLNKGRNNYALPRKGADSPESSLRTRADQLRAEADVLFDQLVRSHGSTRRLSPARSNAVSDERTGAVDARAGQEVRSYGTATPGAASAQGFHYSAGERNTLDGRYYGTGARGQEAERVFSAKDTRLRERVYFYVDSGKGVTPEQGVGAHGHTVRLSNLYDANADTFLQARISHDLTGKDWLNAFETAVLDNGFDGYLNDFGTQRAAVLLGRHAVPVDYLGVGGKQIGEVSQTEAPPSPIAGRRDLPMGKMTGAEWKKLVPEAKVEDGESYYKDQLRFSLARAQTETPAFKKWFGDWQDPKAFSSRYPKDKTPVSQAVSEKGEPLVLYHATNGDFDTFEPGRPTINSTTFGDVETERHAIFATEDVSFAEEYLRSGPGKNVMPIYLDVKSPMDMREGPEGEHIRDIVENSDGKIHNRDFYNLPVTETWALFDGDFGVAFVSAAKKAGYDGAIILENTGNRESSKAVWVAFDPAQIKSAIGNNGDFDGSNPDIRFSPARFDRIAGEFTQRVTAALANPRNTQSVLIHGNTPASMQLIGWKDLPLRVEASELAKIANKPGFETDELIGKLVHDLARPGAMFWNEKQGSLNLLRREDMRGAPAIIAVRADAPVNRERAHLMVTAHRLDNQEALLRKISSGELKPIYLDQANPLVKAAMQKNKYRVQTAEMLAPEKRQARDAVKLGTTSKLLSPADLVNWETEQWGDTPRFSPSRQQVEDDAFAAVERDPAGMIEEYRRRFGNIVDPDQVKQLFPAFAADPSLAAAVHEPSSKLAKLAKLIYAEALKRNNGKPVTFTAGGGGSGKSEAMPLALAAGGLESDGLIYDSTLSSYKPAEQRIDQALATGSKVTVVYTNRPVDAAFEFAMGRSRVVPAKVLAAAHVGASDTIRQLAEHYAGNPDVAILIVNNKGAIEDMQLGQLDDVPTYAYNETERKLHDLAKQALSEGRISQERYDDLLARREQSPPAAGPQQVQEGQPGQDPGRPGERTGSEGPRLAAARSLGRRIDRVIASVDHAVDGLSNLPDQFDYLKNRYLALGKIARVDEITKEIRTAFEKTDPTNKKAVYQYLTTRGATPAAIPSPDIRAIAERIKKTIEYTGDQLVARGLLDQASRDHYRDQYLPRMYLRHMLNDQDYKVIGMGKKPSEMGYLKHRKDIPDEIREVVLGEVKDPAFLSANAIGRAMRDVSLLDWMGQISQNNDWVFPEIFVPWQGKKVTAYWLRAEADRIELQLTHYDAPAKAKAEARVAAMRTLANNTLGAMSAVDHKKYKQIPDTMRYGLLRGMWVRKEIFDDIMGASQIVNADPTWFEDWFGFGGKGTKLTQWWKFTKVALNPPGQIRNFVSNMVMLQLSGVGLHKLPLRLVQAAREITNDGPHWKVAKKYGVTESTFTAQELFRIKRDLVALESQQGKMNSLRWLMNAGAHFLERVSDLYQFSEALGKTIKIIDEMEKGKSEAEAAIEAQKWLFDYSLVPQSVRIARNAPVGMPFLTYQIKVLPRLLEVAAKHPWRFLPWAGLLYGMQAAVASMFGVDDDELEKLKKALPQWLQDRGHTVFLPMRDADGRIQVADVGYFFPWTYYSTAAKHAAEGNMKKLIADDIFGMMSAPIIGGASALISNYDNFSKRPIYNEADPVGYQAAAIANYTYDLMAPPFLSSHGVVSPMGLVDTKFGGKLVQAETGQTNRFGDPRATEGQAIGALVGANFYGMDPEHTRVTNLMVMNSKVLAAERALKARLMDRGLGDEAKAALIRDYQAKMMELNKEMLEYSKESEVPPQLKRTNR